MSAATVAAAATPSPKRAREVLSQSTREAMVKPRAELLKIIETMDDDLPLGSLTQAGFQSLYRSFNHLIDALWWIDEGLGSDAKAVKFAPFRTWIWAEVRKEKSDKVKLTAYLKRLERDLFKLAHAAAMNFGCELTDDEEKSRLEVVENLKNAQMCLWDLR